MHVHTYTTNKQEHTRVSTVWIKKSVKRALLLLLIFFFRLKPMAKSLNAPFVLFVLKIRYAQGWLSNFTPLFFFVLLGGFFENVTAATAAENWGIKVGNESSDSLFCSLLLCSDNSSLKSYVLKLLFRITLSEQSWGRQLLSLVSWMDKKTQKENLIILNKVMHSESTAYRDEVIVQVLISQNVPIALI